MKIFTKNFLLFTAIFAAATLVFRYALSYFLKNEIYSYINFIAIGYALVLFISGWHLGKKDGIYLPQNDLGLRFSVASLVLWTVISYGWFLLKLNASSERIFQVHIGAAIFFFIVLFHALLYWIYARKNNIKGIRRDDIFE